MKVLFLDIDGVCNSEETLKRSGGGMLGIDPLLAFIVGKITLAVPELKVVLSSSWRHFPEGRNQVHAKVVPIHDVTGSEPYDDLEHPHTQRGREIQRWLNAHPEVTHYAIVDDDSDMLPEQMPHFFQTSWKVGITEEIAAAIVAHLS